MHTQYVGPRDLNPSSYAAYVTSTFTTEFTFQTNIFPLSPPTYPTHTHKSFKYFKDIFLSECLVCMYFCVPLALRGKKKTSDPLELD